jgi:hypothetical protein
MKPKPDCLTEAQAAEVHDLAKLACDRVRNALMSVGQLIDDDWLRAGVTTTCAFELVLGARTMLMETGKTEQQALLMIFAGMLAKVDIDLDVLVAETRKFAAGR